MTVTAVRAAALRGITITTTARQSIITIIHLLRNIITARPRLVIIRRTVNIIRRRTALQTGIITILPKSKTQ
jgi:hypothetical protein